MLWIDSVTVPVADPAAAAAALDAVHGLRRDVELDGWTIPLGAAYLELVAGDGPARWAVATFDAPGVGSVVEERHGTQVQVRRAPDAGLPEVVRWVSPRRSPARRPLEHRQALLGIRYLEVAVAGDALRRWLGPGADDLPVRCTASGSGVRSLAIATTGAAIVLDELLTMGTLR